MDLNSLNQATLGGIQELQKVMHGLSQGELDLSMEGDFSGSFAKLQLDCNQTMDQLSALIGTIESSIDAVKRKDLTFSIDSQDMTGFFKRMADGLTTMTSTMALTVSDVAHDASELANMSSQIDMANQNLSNRTTQAATNVEETAATMEQISATTQQNAEKSRKASEIAQAAQERAVQGGEEMTRTLHAMDNINQASRQINDIITVIDEIAFQTNLLALNAAVEAARAGDHGRGFAVVASEVRALAQRSSNAAKEIAALIHRSQERVNEGADLVKSSNDILQDIVSIFQSLSQNIQEISDASQEQAAGVHDINHSITDLDTMIQQNSALVEQMTSATATLRERSAKVTSNMSSFNLNDGLKAI